MARLAFLTNLRTKVNDHLSDLTKMKRIQFEILFFAFPILCHMILWHECDKSRSETVMIVTQTPTDGVLLWSTP